MINETNDRRWNEETKRKEAALLAAGVTEDEIADRTVEMWDEIGDEIGLDATLENFDGAEMRAHAVRRLWRERLGA